MRIAIDIDSTLHHYWDQLAGAARRRFGVDLPYERQVTWEVSALEPEQLRACVSETHREDNVLAAVPYPGAVEVVRGWHEAGHFVLITSHRARESAQATRRWLEEVDLPHDLLHCSYDKLSHCLQTDIDLLIDDSPVNLAGALEAGLAAATVAHPWNAELCASEAIVCAPDWVTLGQRLAPLLGSPIASCAHG